MDFVCFEVDAAGAHVRYCSPGLGWLLCGDLDSSQFAIDGSVLISIF